MGRSLTLRDGRGYGRIWERDVPQPPKREFGGREQSKSMSSSQESKWPWDGGIRSGLKTNGGKKAQIDTMNLQWWQGRETMSREKHMAGLWELLVHQDERRFCRKEVWHIDKAGRKSVTNLELWLWIFPLPCLCGNANPV